MWVPPIYDTTWLNKQYAGLLSASNCTDLACLRHLSVSKIKTATYVAANKAYEAGQFVYGTFYWGPVIDGEIIRDAPLAEFQNGHFTKVPVMVDRDEYEGFSFTNPRTANSEDIVSALETLWQGESSISPEEVLEQYPLSPFNASLLDGLRGLDDILGSIGENITLSDAYGALQAIVGDAVINCPSSFIAGTAAKAGVPAYKSE